MLASAVDSIRLWLHGLGVTVWVGGQLTLAALVPVLRAAGPDVPKRAARAFNRVAWPAFGVLIITGLWNIQAVHGQIKHSSDYRNTLIAKLVIVALSGLAAYLHAKADSKKGRAIWGALTALFALLALFYGIVLGNS